MPVRRSADRLSLCMGDGAHRGAGGASDCLRHRKPRRPLVPPAPNRGGHPWCVMEVASEAWSIDRWLARFSQCYTRTTDKPEPASIKGSAVECRVALVPVGMPGHPAAGGHRLLLCGVGLGQGQSRGACPPQRRRALTGFLFGATGGSVALSPVGRVSGAHINPVVSLAFWRCGELAPGVAAGHVSAQMVGAVLGALSLLLWGPWAASVHVAARMPGPAGPWVAVLGEVGATMCLGVSLFVFLGHRRLRRFTPGLFAPLYALLVWIEAPLSGTSTNSARSLGPALVGRLDRTAGRAHAGAGHSQTSPTGPPRARGGPALSFPLGSHGILHGTRPRPSRSIPG